MHPSCLSVDWHRIVRMITNKLIMITEVIIKIDMVILFIKNEIQVY